MFNKTLVASIMSVLTLSTYAEEWNYIGDHTFLTGMAGAYVDMESIECEGDKCRMWQSHIAYPTFTVNTGKEHIPATQARFYNEFDCKNYTYTAHRTEWYTFTDIAFSMDFPEPDWTPVIKGTSTAVFLEYACGRKIAKDKRAFPDITYEMVPHQQEYLAKKYFR